MLYVSLKLLLAALMLLPVAAALLALWRRWWPAAPASEALLAAGVTLPLVLLVEIVGFGKLPVERPLDHLMWIQIGVGLAAAGVAFALRREVGPALGGVGAGLRTTWAGAGPLGRGVLLFGLLSQSVALVYGHWQSPWTWDELSYHLPQALQPLQDGRIGPVQTGVVWGDSYPRGAALLYYWTIGMTGTDAGIHPVSAAGGFLLMLATFVAGRRLGLTARWAAIATGIVPVAPIFFYLSTNGYIDLIAGGFVATGLAFAMPERRGRETIPGIDPDPAGWSWPSCAACLIALLLAMWAKVTPVPIAGLILGIWGLDRVVRWWAARVRHGRVPRPGPVGLAAAGGMMLALAAIPYVQIWAMYGSPTFPQGLNVGPIRLFEGPMIAGSYLGSDVHALTYFRKYVEFWTEWYTWLYIDSRGGLGPLFTLVMLPSALVCIFGLARPWRIGWLILGLASLSLLVLPVHFVPRYGIWVLLPGAVFAARLGQGLEESPAEGRALGTGFTAALLLLQVWNTFFTVRCFRYALEHYRSFGLPLMTEHRTRVVHDVAQRDIPMGPTPETRRAMYEHMRDGETLVVAIYGHHSMFYDPDYRYRVEHRPPERWGYPWPSPGDPGLGADAVPAWLEGLERDGVAMVAVYEGSPEDRALAQGASGYRRIHRQEPDEQGPVAIHLYRRAE